MLDSLNSYLETLPLWPIGISGAVGLYFIINTVSTYIRMCNYWSKHNVPGPKPLPFLGNTLGVTLNDRYDLKQGWREKYGKICGIHEGSKPSLVIADAELMLQLMIKDFDFLPDHKITGGDFLEDNFSGFIFNLSYEPWKRLRALLSPTFTCNKIKKMFKMVDFCSTDAIHCIREHVSSSNSETIVEIGEVFHFYSLSTIISCCYSLKIDRGHANDLKSLAKKDAFVNSILAFLNFKAYKFVFINMLPKFIVKKTGLRVISNSLAEPFAGKIRGMINRRRQSGKKFEDYLQMIIDAKLSDKLDLTKLDEQENHHVGQSSEALEESQKNMARELKSASLDEGEILSSAMWMIIVAIETTSSLLTQCAYALAFHPEVQERLYEEMKAISTKSEETKGNEGEFDHELLISNKYLDAVISETLRISPPVLFTDRVIRKDYYLEKYNLNLPKDMHLMFNIWAVHNDSDYWQEPDKFNPERFMPGNKEKIIPGSYCPFGLGPRYCLGMRFSLMESKLVLAKMVLNFKLKPVPGTVFPPPASVGLATQKVKDSRVRVSVRN